jgi:streptomycin 6-kinase
MPASPSSPPDAAAVARRHSLALVGGNLAERGSLSVHRVVDRDGRRLVLKHSRPRYGGDEAAWLEAHRDQPGAARLAARLEDGFLLLDEVPGGLVADLPGGGAEAAREVGQLLRALERPAANGVAGLERRIAAQERLLPPAPGPLGRAYERLARRVLRGLARCGRTTYVHGDLHPRNLIRSPRGLVAIDPFGLAGPVAWDMAMFAAITYGGSHLERRPARSHDQILAELVAGYGAQPPLLEELASFWLLLVQRMQLRLRRPALAWLAPPAGRRLAAAA